MILSLKLAFCIIGMNSVALDIHTRTLKSLKVLVLSAGRCVLPQWSLNSTPTVSQWIQSVMGLIPSEAISFWLKNKALKFYHIWEPFLDEMMEPRLSWQHLLNGID